MQLRMKCVSICSKVIIPREPEGVSRSYVFPVRRGVSVYPYYDLMEVRFVSKETLEFIQRKTGMVYSDERVPYRQ